jgi:uncharacterized protein (TIGR03067 family)
MTGGRPGALAGDGSEAMPRHLCLILVAWFILAAPGPGADPGEEDAAAKDLAKLQGKWKFVEEDIDGMVRKSDENGYVIVIEKEFNLWYDAEGKLALKHSLKLDPSKSPKEMDQTTVYSRLFPNDKGHTYHCIYRLEGDELKIAMPISPYRERPKEFTTQKGSRFSVHTYKRVKP